MAEDSEREAAVVKRAGWMKYTQIENVDSSKWFDKVQALALTLGQEVDWIATEKVHGANFSFVTDGTNIKYASRTRVLDSNADFFNADSKMTKYHRCVKKAFSLAKEKYAHLELLVIYGEYFGGFYPGHTIEKGLKKVQGGVAYSPDHHFYAFDVSVNAKGYIDFDDCQTLLSAAGFPLVAEPLRRGSLRQVLATDVEQLESTIPARLGLEPPTSFRIAEGIVIRPSKEAKLDCNRVLLKKKAAAFWENTNQKDMAAKVKRQMDLEPSSDDVSGAIEFAKGLINENRLRAVVSKDPSLLQVEHLHKLRGLVIKDVFEDLEKCYTDELASLGKDVGIVCKAVALLIQTFVDETINLIRSDIGE